MTKRPATRDFAVARACGGPYWRPGFAGVAIGMGMAEGHCCVQRMQSSWPSCKSSATSAETLLQAAYQEHVCCIAGNLSESRPATGAAADDNDDWETGKGKAGKGKRGKGGAKGKRGGGGGGGGGAKAVSTSNGGVGQPGGDDGGSKLLSTEALEQMVIKWCPELEEGPPELVCESSVPYAAAVFQTAGTVCACTSSAK